MLYEHNDPGFLIRYARRLIDLAKLASDRPHRDALLSAASRAITRAERLMQPPVVILAEVA